VKVINDVDAEGGRGATETGREEKLDSHHHQASEATSDGDFPPDASPYRRRREEEHDQRRQGYPYIDREPEASPECSSHFLFLQFIVRT
jgi:hypothetical protein